MTGRYLTTWFRLIVAIAVLSGATSQVSHAQQSSPVEPAATNKKNYVPVWTSDFTLGNSVMYQSSGNVGVGTTTPGSKLDVAGDVNFSGEIRYQGTPLISVPMGAGDINVAVGPSALISNTIGQSNTAIGNSALYKNTSGQNNEAIGEDALHSNTEGSLNVAVGVNSLFDNTSGLGNIAIGGAALYNNTTGSNNIAIGYEAGDNIGAGANDIYIGGSGSSDESNTIRIGTPRMQTAFFGAGIAGATVSGVPVLINTSTGQLGIASSSRRYKQDIKDMGDASAGLMRLRPVTFRYEKPFADGSEPVQYGLIAEEVAGVYPDLVARGADGQIETVKYQLLDSMLLNEVQRQEREIHGLQEQNQALQERLARLEAALSAVSAKHVK